MDLSVLNNKQEEAVRTTEGPVMVVAGAGSGKTRVLTYRIAYLISELGVSPDSILAVTFTNKAAREMKERVEQLLEMNTSNMWISTFHSFGARFLRREIRHLDGYRNDFQIIDDDDQLKIVKNIIKEMASDQDPKFALGYISALKNLEPVPDKLSTFEIMELDNIYMKYNDNLMDNNLLDFDDLILLTIRVLEENVDVLEKYTSMFEYILVDEFQDTNNIQFKLVKLLGLPIKNVFIVGDQDQSIYSFRGAVVENINYFKRDFKDVKTIVLEQNYRSTQRILNLANNVIDRNPGRIKKNLFSKNSDGLKAKYYKADSSYGETIFVANEIQKLHREEQIEYKDMAILYRLNSLSKGFEDEFIKAKIPYVIYGGVGFFSRKEVKDMLAYLRLTLNHEDNFSLERIINVPKRKIGDKMVENLRKTAQERQISMFDAIDYLGGANLLEFKSIIQRLSEIVDKVSPESMIDNILSFTNYREMLEKEDELDRLDNVLELKSSLKDAYEYYEGTNSQRIGSFLSDVALRTDVDSVQESDNCVKLMSFHQAKGLEYKVVFMVAMEEGIFPPFKSLGNPRELDEEYRICYVGITRARERLYFSSCDVRRLYGKDNVAPRSEFFRYIKESDYELYGHTFRKSSETISSYKPREHATIVSSTGKYKTGDKVLHKVFGKGMVVSVQGDKLTIAFAQEYGIKILQANHPSFTKLEEE